MTDRGGTAPKRGGRGQKAPWIAPAGRTGEVRCPLCGSPNGAAAGFCRWCGTPLGRPTDPVLGTTTRRALDERRGAPVGTLLSAFAAVALAGVVGFVALNSGLLPGGAEGSSPPRSAASGAASPAASGSAGPSGSLEASPGPGASPSAPVGSPDASPGVPGPSASPPPTTPPAETDFTCEPASVADASSSAWRIVRGRWGQRGGFDQLALVLELRRPDAPVMGRVTVESMPASEVTERYGLPAPTSGDRAIVLSLEGPFQLPTEIDGDPDLTAIEELSVAEDDDGIVRAVIGVTGEGCHRLGVAGWAFQSAPQEVEVILDVRHE